MKNVIYISLLYFVLSCNSIEKTNNYIRVIEQMNNTPASSVIDNIFNEYYCQNDCFPYSVADYYNWLVDSIAVNMLKGSYLRDPYVTDDNLFEIHRLDELEESETEFFMYNKAIDDEKQLIYIPLYDRILDSPQSFLVLSRGEDGFFDNRLNDKLFFDDWFSKIKAYNIKDFMPELKKTVILYPVFNKQMNSFTCFSQCVDDTFLKDEKILLCGDTLFDSKLIQSYSVNYNTSLLTFYYPKYSYWRAIFGKKDYIVSFGRKIIKYKITQRE